MVCLLLPPAPVGLLLYLLRHHLVVLTVMARGFLPILVFSRGPGLPPSFDAVLAAVMPARMLPGVV